MGLRPLVRGAVVLLVAGVPLVGASSAAPVVFDVAWERSEAEHFPHPAVCMGTPTVDRQRSLGPGFYLDPDGCAAGGQAYLAFLDADGSTTFSAADPVYVQGSLRGKVAAGDLRVDAGAPTTVRSGDGDAGRTTSPVTGGVWDLVDRDASQRWSAADVAYFDVDANGHLSPGDLSVDADLRRPPLGASGMVYPLHATSATACFVDDDGSAAWSLNEPVYLVVGRRCSNVAVGDLRIVATRSQAAGTLVAESHLDFRNPLATLWEAGALAVASSPRAAAFDLDASQDLSAGDVIAVGLQRVHETTSAPLEAVTTWAYLDLDRNGAFSAPDILYADRDHNGFASVGDVRLSGFVGAAFGSLVAEQDPEAAGPLPPKGHAAPAAEDGSAPRDAKGSPFPAVPATLGFIAGFVAAMRRRRRRRAV